ncbi:NHL repeat-containing protein [Actinomyces howellii]|uniref:Streptogramin lyase n=1 Tax=Actinomyces howellii TaxID=52771 RepID=A0A3S4RC56_9ACTO|nr:hypothetical protein [Actinomyces howellii]VEG29760.1 Uncharacterised protein [Actinomyces howellii]
MTRPTRGARALVPVAPHRTDLRRLVALALSCVLALGGALALSAPARAVAPGEEALPQVASPAPSLPAIGTTTSAQGRPLAVVVAGGDGGVLHVVDLLSRQVVAREAFAPTGTDVQPWGYATLSDRSVLMASGGGQLFRIDAEAPAGQKVVTLSSSSVPGWDEVAALGDFYWDVVVDEQDRAYVASHSPTHGGRVLALDTRANGGAGQWSDLLGAPLQQGQTDVRSLAYEDGLLYAGTGTTSPSVHRIDVATRQSTELSLPESVTQGSKGITRLEVRGANLYVGAPSPGSGVQPACGGTCVLDPATGAARTHDGQAMGVGSWNGEVVTRPEEPEKVYYYVQLRGERTIQEYDPRTNSSRTLVTDADLTTRLSSSSWATHEVLVTSEKDSGALGVYDASSASVDALASGHRIEGAARSIQALAGLPDGSVYGSWYMTTPALLRVTPGQQAAGTTSELAEAPNGQVEGFGVGSGWMVTGVYPSGSLVRYRLGADGRPGAPEEQTASIEHGQARPFAVVPVGGERFAVASTPADHEVADGALSVFDAGTNEVVTYPFSGLTDAAGAPVEAVSGRRPVSLAYRDGKVYVGTSARAGGSAQDGPVVIEFDLSTRAVTRVSEPVAGQRAVTALAAGEDGRLYATTGRRVLALSPSSLAVTASVELRLGYEDARPSQLIHHGGTLYGVMGGRLQAVAAADGVLGSPQVLADIHTGPQGKVYVHSLTLGADSNLYYARGSGLYRYVL